MNTVKGVVEGVGTKFNGSLKVNGEWLNLSKGVVNSAKQGDTVELVMKEWEFKGRKGISVGEVKVLSAAPQASQAPKAKLPVPPMAVSTIPYVGRDFDKEARGKTLSIYIQAQLSNPSVNLDDLEALFERAVKLRDMTFKD